VHHCPPQAIAPQTIFLAASWILAVSHRCDGPDEAPISCSRFAVRSTTEPSVPGSVTYSSHCPTKVRSGQRQRAPPSLWTVPMIRKGQVQNIGGHNMRAQAAFIAELFDVLS
jgi:hypothetical protein